MPERLGQNFLNDPEVLERIIEASKPAEAGFVIEIGPGKGVLTEKLAHKAKKVIAIELDDRLIPMLEEKFKDAQNVEIIHEDVLKINLPEMISSHGLENARYKLIANIPYYITSPIIRLFLEQEGQPQEMILMVQKEVAERIAARAGQMSILSVSVQYYARTEILFGISKNSFSPAPQVDSALIRIVPEKKFEKETDKQFFRIVRAGFSAKRKTLINNLSNGLQLEKSVVAENLEKAGLSSNVRAQELGISDWQRLVEIFQGLEK